jgi:hypothetical protein
MPKVLLELEVFKLPVAVASVFSCVPFTYNFKPSVLDLVIQAWYHPLLLLNVVLLLTTYPVAPTSTLVSNFLSESLKKQ